MPSQPRKFIKVDKAPPYVKELIGDMRTTIPVAQSFDAVERVILEAQRNVTSLENQSEIAPTIIAIDHILNHLRLIRDQGNHDIKYNESTKQ